MATAIDVQSENTSDVVPTWAQENGGESTWVEIDNALRGIARRRAALDADEARWLREAEKLQIWKPLGMPTLLDYMERTLGYGPRAAYERLRVAKALGELPVLAEALSQGELSYSAVRELSRVATAATDEVWTKAAKGKNLRQIEVLVAGHEPGDLPDDPADPEVRTHVVRFELAPETFAVLRQARSILDADHRVNLTDDEFITVLANMVLEGAAEVPENADDETAHMDTDDESSAEATGKASPTGADAPPSVNRESGVNRAKHQLAITLCGGCRQGWQLGAGAVIPIGPEAVARAECDAQHLGALDAEVPERAYQDISPAVARLVWRRDEGRCQTPGCRSSRGLEIHHIVPRAQGGSHEPANLRLHCSACHHAQHDDRLTITDDGKRVDVRTAKLAKPDHGAALHEAVSVRTAERASSKRAHGAAPDTVVTHTTERAGTKVEHSAALDTAVIRAQAKDALVGLGWRSGIARAATEAALTALGPAATLEPLIREALRQCSKLHHP